MHVLPLPQVLAGLIGLIGCRTNAIRRPDREESPGLAPPALDAAGLILVVER